MVRGSFRRPFTSLTFYLRSAAFSFVLCREQLDSLRDTAVVCVQEFNRLKHERRLWAKLTAEQRATRPYPIAPVPPIDRAHPLYTSTQQAVWSLFPGCPSLRTAAVHPLPVLQQAEWLAQQEQPQHSGVKVEENNGMQL